MKLQTDHLQFKVCIDGYQLLSLYIFQLFSPSFNYLVTFFLYIWARAHCICLIKKLVSLHDHQLCELDSSCFVTMNPKPKNGPVLHLHILGPNRMWTHACIWMCSLLCQHETDERRCSQYADQQKLGLHRSAKGCVAKSAWAVCQPTQSSDQLFMCAS